MLLWLPLLSLELYGLLPLTQGETGDAAAQVSSCGGLSLPAASPAARTTVGGATPGLLATAAAGAAETPACWAGPAALAGESGMLTKLLPLRLLWRAKVTAAAAAPEPARASARSFWAAWAASLGLTPAPPAATVLLLETVVGQLSPVSKPVGLAARAAAAAAADGLPVLTAAGAAPTAALLLLRVSTAAAMSARPEPGSSQPLLLLVCMARPPTGVETAAAPVAAGADLSLRVATMLLLLAGTPAWPGSLLALPVLLLLGVRVRIAAAIASTAESLFAAGCSTGAAATLQVLLSAVGALLLLDEPDLGAATPAGAGAGAPAAMEGDFCRTAAAICATSLVVSRCLNAAPLLVGSWPKLLLTAPAASPALLLLCCCALHAGATVRTMSLPAAAAAARAPGSGCCSCCLLSTAAANASTDEAVSDMRTCRPVLGSTASAAPAAVAVVAVAAGAGRGRDPREVRLLPAAVAPAAPPALSRCHSFFRSAATVRASDRPASPLLAESQACAAAQGSAGGGSHLGRTLPRIPPLAAVPVLVVLLVLLTLLLRDSGRACSLTCSCSTSCCCLRQKDS